MKHVSTRVNNKAVIMNYSRQLKLKQSISVDSCKWKIMTRGKVSLCKKQCSVLKAT